MQTCADQKKEIYITRLERYFCHLVKDERACMLVRYDSRCSSLFPYFSANVNRISDKLSSERVISLGILFKLIPVYHSMAYFSQIMCVRSFSVCIYYNDYIVHKVL